MPEPRPQAIRRETPPQIEARTLTEKIIRGLITFAGKEAISPVIAAMLALGSGNAVNNYLNQTHGVPVIEQSILDVKKQIKIIRERQEKMGKISEWKDRVWDRNDFLNSVNLLETKLKTLELKKTTVANSAEAVKPYWDMLIFAVMFAIFIGYVREWVGSIIDKLDASWREKKIVSETNEALFDLYNELAELEERVLKIAEDMANENATNQESIRAELEAIIAELKLELNKLPENKEEKHN